MADEKENLTRYLYAGRDAMMWKLDGLGEYDVRRPMTPTGTNLLGIVKHVATVAAGYFGETFDRRFDEPLPWVDEGAEPNADLWVTADETRADMIGLWDRAWAHAEATIAALDLDAVGRVAWWPAERAEVTLHQILCHMVSEVARHAGQMDILRESIDGAVGMRPGRDNMYGGDEAWWVEYRERVERAARAASA